MKVYELIEVLQRHCEQTAEVQIRFSRLEQDIAPIHVSIESDELVVIEQQREDEDPLIETDTQWSHCSCGHIAQDHTAGGECERKSILIRDGKYSEEPCPCKGYDGKPREVPR